MNYEDAQSSEHVSGTNEHVSSEAPMEEHLEAVNLEDAQSSKHVSNEHVPSESSEAPMEDLHAQ